MRGIEGAWKGELEREFWAAVQSILQHQTHSLCYQPRAWLADPQSQQPKLCGVGAFPPHPLGPQGHAKPSQGASVLAADPAHPAL